MTQKQWLENIIPQLPKQLIRSLNNPPSKPPTHWSNNSIGFCMGLEDGSKAISGKAEGLIINRLFCRGGTSSSDLCILPCHYRWAVNPIKLANTCRGALCSDASWITNRFQCRCRKIPAEEFDRNTSRVHC